MKVTLTWTTPTTKTDGTALPLTAIKSCVINRNGKQLATPKVVAGVNSYDDTTTLTGHDVYDVQYTTTDGFVTLPSNAAAVHAVHGERVTDLKAVLDSSTPQVATEAKPAQA